MTHLYCPTPGCGEYLGSLGGDSCRHCGWQAGTVKIPEPPVARLEWSLHVDCPKCNEGNDLASPEHDGEQEIAKRIFTNDWDKLEGWEITCDHCGHEFTIEKVEY